MVTTGSLCVKIIYTLNQKTDSTVHSTVNNSSLSWGASPIQFTFSYPISLPRKRGRGLIQTYYSGEQSQLLQSPGSVQFGPVTNSSLIRSLSAVQSKNIYLHCLFWLQICLHIGCTSIYLQISMFCNGASVVLKTSLSISPTGSPVTMFSEKMVK
jgi:hypothetical protein